MHSIPIWNILGASFLSIRKYTAFLRTVETGSITQCANELGYTQSAVSKMIADLEDEWQVTLLNRSHSGITITSEGMSLLPQIRSVVKDYEDLKFAVSEVHGVNSGLLRLGCFTSLSTSIMPNLLKTFHEKYPNIKIEMMCGEYNDIADWLRRGTIDCGFLAMPVAKEFDVLFLYQDSLIAILPEGHPLSDAPCYPISHLPEDNFVGLMEVQDYEINLFLDQLNVHPRRTYEVTSDFALMSMVESGLGISIIHDLMLRPKRYHVVRLPLDVTQFRSIGMATKKGVVSSLVLKLFKEHVISYKKQSRFFEGMEQQSI